MAITSASQRFIAIDVGAPGRHSDSGVFSRCALGAAILNGNITFPAPRPYPGTDGEPQPCVIVSDGAFPLRPNLMRPFPGRGISREQRIYNYRHSRARRSSESTFGGAAVKWRVLYTRISTKPHTTISTVKAVCLLHNFLYDTNPEPQRPPGNFTPPMPGTSINVEDAEDEDLEEFATPQALRLREALMAYFVNENPLPWQDEQIERGTF